jgi:hypothetical protein
MNFATTILNTQQQGPHLFKKVVKMVKRLEKICACAKKLIE